MAKRVIAALVLIIGAFILFKIVLGFLAVVGTVLLVIVVLAAVVWALSALL